MTSVKQRKSPQTCRYRQKYVYLQPKSAPKLADRVGRLIMFKECLANNIVPFIITDDLKMFYYRGLHEWGHVRSSSARLLLEGRKNGYLTDTCLTAQDQYKEILKHLGIEF